ncbi:MAG: Mrp/NBP35 family ATP-binding protein [Chitinophagales bacterium]
MKITKENILKALSRVEDPDFKQDLVSLKMIKDVDCTDTTIAFTVELTTPACPLKEKIRQDCEDAIREDFGGEVGLAINMTANVTSARNPNINILPNVKNIICVASGKGGVGKSTVSTNLALALADKGAKVGLIDADIHGPSIPQMMGVTERPSVREIKGKHYIVPTEVKGVKVLSIGLLVDERQAIVWRGPMVTSALKQFVNDVIWGKLDYLIIDMPPGTGDVHLTMTQTVSVTGALIVTTPQDVALADAKKALSMFQMPKINVPVIGVVENMAYFTPPDMQDKKYHIFGKDGGKRLAELYEVPFLGEIPIEMPIREGGDNGKPVYISEEDSIAKDAFEEIATKTAQAIAIKNLERKEEPSPITPL